MPVNERRRAAGRIILAAATLLALLACGCSRGPKRLPVNPVKGRMTFAGRPAAGAMVVFHPLDGEAADAKLRPVAAVQDDGSFAPHTYDHGDGVPAGRYALTVHWFAPQGRSEDEGGPAMSRLPARYAKPDTSGLEITVEKGPNELKPIALAR